MENVEYTTEEVYEAFLFLSEWDEFLQYKLGLETYTKLALEFSKIITEKYLKNLGASDEEAKEACDETMKLYSNSKDIKNTFM